ncbi:10449_t:CDS:10 [Dentiscutata erythropus]|uniref:10449_t:CDS:1 n=1 Tax=Dentiscutata erythropus TaxID=1348616 RepID=A0A9N9HLI0_9GLOM|nr:10449_t:CDS:10 [Dentiscutata erythropus]
MYASRPASLRAVSRIVTSRIFRPKLVTTRAFSYVKPLYQQEENQKLSEYQKKKILLKKKFATEFVAKVTRPAPFWEALAVVGDEIKILSLNDFEDKFLIMLFYPLDFTFGESNVIPPVLTCYLMITRLKKENQLILVCPTELNAFSDRAQEFKNIGAEVVAISCDSQFSHLAWSKMPRGQGGIGGIKIPLVADYSKKISEDYGVLYEEKGIPFRGTVIIDDKGTVRVIHINDTEIGRSVDEVLRLVQAIQFANDYGEVCPANWKKGDATIVPDPKKSMAYFSKLKNEK